MTSVSSSMRERRPSASCDGLATISARRSSSMSRWRREEAKNAIWSVPAAGVGGVGGEHRLELVLVEREERRGGTARHHGHRRRRMTPAVLLAGGVLQLG